jgi:hypothetical protein
MSDDLFDIDIPQKVVDKIRMYYGDYPEFNELLEGNEVSDEKIRLAIELYVDHFNAMPPELTVKYGVDNFPSKLVLFKGVIIQLLTMRGLIESRNFLNFRDDNVSIQVKDKAQDYQQWIQMLVQSHREEAMNIKIAENAKSAYDFHASPDGVARSYF